MNTEDLEIAMLNDVEKIFNIVADISDGEPDKVLDWRWETIVEEGEVSDD